MKCNTFFLFLFPLITTTSCGNSSSPNKSSPETTTISQPATENLIVDTTTKPPQTPVTVPAPVNNTSKAIAPVLGSAAGLNPEHGKPGHRCDISVGAPLNSKPTLPAATTPPSVVSQSPPTINKKAAPITTVATGLNPEHGKPGHRCDISVGAPLNSKPTQQSATTQPTVSQTSPVTNKQATPVPTVAKGINPAHGQPGHRCDIAVGAALNSKPAQ